MIADLIDDFMETLRAELDATWLETTPGALGLDSRAGCRRMWLSEEGIAVEGSTRQLDYYGGFEYVDSEYRRTVGDFTFFSAENRRAREHVCRALDPEAARALRLSYGDRDEDDDDE